MRVIGRPFQKGQSGNPLGRRHPNSVAHNQTRLDLKEAARGYASDALVVVVELMRAAKTPAAVRLSCANTIFDRGFGKPVQPIEAQYDLARLSDEALETVYEILSDVQIGPPQPSQALTSHIAHDNEPQSTQ